MFELGQPTACRDRFEVQFSRTPFMKCCPQRKWLATSLQSSLSQRFDDFDQRSQGTGIGLPNLTVSIFMLVQFGQFPCSLYDHMNSSCQFFF